MFLRVTYHDGSVLDLPVNGSVELEKIHDWLVGTLVRRNHNDWGNSSAAWAVFKYDDGSKMVVINMTSVQSINAHS